MEIKYRAYDNQTNRFEYWDSINNKFDGIFWVMIKRPEFEKPNQFTGLKDKNGKEIYKDDILDLNHHTCKNGVVVYGSEELMFTQGKWTINNIVQYIFYFYHNNGNDIDMRKYEIIGNIYENKELIDGD